MEREKIERLVIDSAAGQLSEDAEALFCEYLAEHPEANKWAEDMLEIYQKTGAAIGEKTKCAAMPDISMADVSIKPHSMAYLLPIARWAAVVIFAALIGAAAGRWTKSPVLIERPVQVAGYPNSTVNRNSMNIEDTGESFWREKALAMFQAKPSMARKASITGPTLWEKYRQFIKERHHE